MRGTRGGRFCAATTGFRVSRRGTTTEPIVNRTRALFELCLDFLDHVIPATGQVGGDVGRSEVVSVLRKAALLYQY